MKSLVTMIALLAACHGAYRAEGDDGGPTPDGSAPTCGELVCDETPAPTCVDDDTLRTFSATCEDDACSYPSEDTECGALGCCEDHCCGFDPSNAGEFGAVEPTGLVVAPPNGAFDTATECASTSALGRCEVVDRGDAGEACVCRADAITIGDLRINGPRALVLLALREVTVTGRLSVAGRTNVPGPGARYRYVDPAGEAGGGLGGGFGSVGGSMAGIGEPPPVYGDPSLVPLVGGMTGQVAGGAGGGGGGALQITAGDTIRITGVINAGGGGGGAGLGTWTFSGGGGGGSGGAILLEAPTVIVQGSLLANGGGGGGGGGNGGTAGDGVQAGSNPDPATPAAGGWGRDGAGCALNGYVDGGTGGYGATGAMAAGSGEWWDTYFGCLSGGRQFVGGGGGGGGVGRIRINTKTGCQCGGTISPNATFGSVVTQ